MSDNNTYNPNRRPGSEQSQIPQSRSSAAPRKPANPQMITLLSAVIFGICLIIAAGMIRGAVNKLTTAVTEQTFSSSYSSPSTITVKSTAEKNYFTADEAADYLNLTVDDITAAIAKGDIDEYIKTSSGYSIAKDELDSYFDNEAYQTLVGNNSSSSSDGEE